MSPKDGIDGNIVFWGKDETSEMGVDESGLKKEAVYPAANNNSGY